MESITLSAKNYRCFSDSQPATIEIGKGFTALVGQNNSGKSSFLKMIYELREVWSFFQRGNPALIHLLQGKSQGASPIGVYDPNEIFFDGNDRDIEVEIDLTRSTERPKDPSSLRKLVLISKRSVPNSWYAQFLFGPQYQEITALKEKPLRIVDSGEVHTKDQSIRLNLSSLYEVMNVLRQSIYIGPFRNAINEGSGNYFDLAIGTSFVTTWHEWKTGQSKSQNQAITRITEDIRRIFDFVSLEINASERLKTLQIAVDGKPYKLPELGAGIAQFIIVFANAMIKRPAFVLIDEPELNLHPSLQIDFLTSLATYASEGVAFATHSVGLARATAERIYSFRKSTEYSFVRRFERTAKYTEFLGEMSFSSFQDLGFERVLLVEGVTDVRTFQQLLRKLHKDHKIILIPLGGDQLIRQGTEQELAELRRLGARVAVIIDRESPDPAATDKRNVFAEMCRGLNFDVCVTERRAIENYFSDRAIKKVKGEKFRALATNEPLNALENGWSKSDNWRIAHEMDFNEIMETDLGQFLVSL